MVDDARILIAQHARTSALLGVDFLPLGKAPEVMSAQSERASRREAQAQATPSAVIEPPDFQDEGETVHPISCEALRASYAHLEVAQDRLDALRGRYEADAPHQHFNARFTNIVFGEGDPCADLMFVGEAPGEQEDLTGRAFVGRAGQLLEKMIVAMGLDRGSVYICNVLKTRPPGNATPTQHESALCAPYLIEQIRIIRPRVIVTLGLPASHLLLGVSSPMRSLRGHWHAFPPASSSGGIFSGVSMEGLEGIEIMATYHPAYLLRSYTEENRRKVWSDLLEVMKKLGLGSG